MVTGVPRHPLQLGRVSQAWLWRWGSLHGIPVGTRAYGAERKGRRQVRILVVALWPPFFRLRRTGDLDAHCQRKWRGVPQPGSLQDTVVPWWPHQVTCQPQPAGSALCPASHGPASSRLCAIVWRQSSLKETCACVCNRECEGTWPRGSHVSPRGLGACVGVAQCF